MLSRKKQARNIDSDLIMHIRGVKKQTQPALNKSNQCFYEELNKELCHINTELGQCDETLKETCGKLYIFNAFSKRKRIEGIRRESSHFGSNCLRKCNEVDNVR